LIKLLVLETHCFFVLGSDEVAVKVVAVDRGVPPLRAETVILFRVGSTTTTSFAFPEENVTALVSENLPAGTFVAAIAVNLQSFVSYQLLDRGDGGKNFFAIGPSTGAVTTTAVLDFEKRKKYDLMITATDEKGKLAMATLTVLVVDVNGNEKKIFN
jgi:hypothetical protein